MAFETVDLNTFDKEKKYVKDETGYILDGGNEKIEVYADGKPVKTVEVDRVDKIKAVFPFPYVIFNGCIINLSRFRYLETYKAEVPLGIRYFVRCNCLDFELTISPAYLIKEDAEKFMIEAWERIFERIGTYAVADRTCFY